MATATGVRAQFSFSADGGATFEDIAAPAGAGSIAGGEAGTAQRLWQNVAPGDYLVRVTADPANTIEESDETNNMGTFPVSVSTDLLPDVSVVSLDATPQAQADAGIDVPLVATVRNDGPSVAKAVRVQFLVSSDGGSTYSTVGGPVSAGNIASGELGTATRLWTNTGAGDFQIKVVADPADAILERDEANNESTFPLNIPLALLPDVTPNSLTANPAPDGNGNIDVALDALIRNDGPSRANSTRVQFAFSADGGATFEAIAAPASAGNISGGGAGSAQRVWQNAAPGEYLLRVTADPDDSIAEGDETNNAATFPVSVSTALLPDLSEAALDATAQAIPTAGIDAPLTATIQNGGSSLARSVHVQFLASSDGGVTFQPIGNPVSAGNIEAGGAGSGTRLEERRAGRLSGRRSPTRRRQWPRATKPTTKRRFRSTCQRLFCLTCYQAG
ncbi:MAG: CARDB domain-containing protein [Bryobacterales bacterium]